MKIVGYQVVLDSGESIDLPQLPVDATVRVWTVPSTYKTNGVFVSTCIDGGAMDIPACDHSEPIFVQTLPAHPDVVLASAKAAKNAEINQWRMDANSTTFPYQGKTFACDALSRSDLDGTANTVALTGAFPVGFPNAWKAVDNTFIALPTLDAFRALYGAMSAQGSTNFTHAQALKATLASATTIDEVNSVVW